MIIHFLSEYPVLSLTACMWGLIIVILLKDSNEEENKEK